MLLDIIHLDYSSPFQSLLGFMTSHHVTCYVTTVSHASSLSIKRKKNSKEKKYIKSRKIEKEKEKS